MSIVVLIKYVKYINMLNMSMPSPFDTPIGARGLNDGVVVEKPSPSSFLSGRG
jgi:hypothetical protein